MLAKKKISFSEILNLIFTWIKIKLINVINIKKYQIKDIYLNRYFYKISPLFFYCKPNFFFKNI